MEDAYDKANAGAWSRPVEAQKATASLLRLLPEDAGNTLACLPLDN